MVEVEAYQALQVEVVGVVDPFQEVAVEVEVLTYQEVAEVAGVLTYREVAEVAGVLACREVMEVEGALACQVGEVEEEGEEYLHCLVKEEVVVGK